MPSREEAIRRLRESLPALRADFGVRKLSLFGSVARSAQGADSDVDIIAEFERPMGFRFVEFAERIEEILGAKADVLTPAGVASIRNPRIARSIMESAIDV